MRGGEKKEGVKLRGKRRSASGIRGGGKVRTGGKSMREKKATSSPASTGPGGGSRQRFKKKS